MICVHITFYFNVHKRLKTHYNEQLMDITGIIYIIPV